MLEHIRLVLMILGGLIILGVVVDSFRRSSKKRNRFMTQEKQTGRAIVVGDPAVEDVSTPRVAGVNPDCQRPAAVTPNDLVVISVMNPDGFPFDAAKVKNAIYTVGFVFGEAGIYEFHEGIKKNGSVIFGLASATKPGVFDQNNLESHACVGLTLFMDMRNTANPLSSFEQLLKSAIFLRQILSGELREGQREPWTPHSARHCREAIRQYVASKEPVSS